jgi:hypothetical protein
VFAPARGVGPFRVAVWLHGYRGYSAKGYFPGATAAQMQGRADSLGAVIAGFPATVELGDGTQRWSEDPDTDHAYVQAELRKVAKAVNDQEQADRVNGSARSCRSWIRESSSSDVTAPVRLQNMSHWVSQLSP